MEKNKGWLCYLNGDSYFYGVVVLYESLKRSKTKYPFYCMTVNVSIEVQTKLQSIGIIVINKPAYPFPKHFYVNEQQGLQYWTNALDKLQIFSLYEEFDKFVYLDCDMMVFRNIDHLFDKQDMTASEDAFWITGNVGHKNFNAGLMVVEPNKDKWLALEKFFTTQFTPRKLKKAFPDGGCVHDQLILNLFFKNWLQVPTAQLLFTYNFFAIFADKYQKSISYEDVVVAHYTTQNKPFMKQVYDKYPVERTKFNTLKERLYMEYIQLFRAVKDKYSI